MITLEAFEQKYSGKSLLYNNVEADRGQCVQYICYYAVEVLGTPVIWADAAEWWYSGAYPQYYDRIPPDQLQRGDIIIWDRVLPGSGGAGHIAFMLVNYGGTFISSDSNWGGKYAHQVSHNWQYVIGGLRAKTTPAPITQGDEMITTAEQSARLWKLLRPNGIPTQTEIDALVNKQTFAGFLITAEHEVNMRDANYRAQSEQLAQLSVTINQLNQTITNVRSDDQADKQQVADALAKVADLTAQLETQHDLLIDAQEKLKTPAVTPAPSFLVKFLARFIKK